MKLYLYAALIAAATICPSASAQSFKAGANIPFNFKVGDSVMPAGKYNVSEKENLLTVSHVGTPATVFRLTIPVSRSTAPPKSTLRFTRYGNEYYLTSFWNSGAHEGRAVIPSKHEKELARLYSTYETAAVSLKPPSH
jgi:hypothetical protein